jgi:hypothetical protein
VSDKKTPSSRLAKSEKAELLFLNEHFSDKHNEIDYRTNKAGLLSLKATEFLHRFLLHVLPAGFVKIRHYGIMSTRNKTHCIALVRMLFQVPMIERPEKGKSWIELYQTLYGKHPKLCPCCKIGMMEAVEVFLPSRILRIRDGPQIEPNRAFCKQQQ